MAGQAGTSVKFYRDKRDCFWGQTGTSGNVLGRKPAEHTNTHNKRATGPQPAWSSSWRSQLGGREPVSYRLHQPLVPHNTQNRDNAQVQAHTSSCGPGMPTPPIHTTADAIVCCGVVLGCPKWRGIELATQPRPSRGFQSREESKRLSNPCLLALPRAGKSGIALGIALVRGISGAFRPKNNT